ncbi:hypothetical protein AB0L57_30110 [Nocardia sp. NPDC052254]|uniref:hypothetical protein n=1 Tax=Nocardia sp. NPDC052254 TaxID=3155681 RepID=UPI003444F6F8
MSLKTWTNIGVGAASLIPGPIGAVSAGVIGAAGALGAGQGWKQALGEGALDGASALIPGMGVTRFMGRAAAGAAGAGMLRTIARYAGRGAARAAIPTGVSIWQTSNWKDGTPPKPKKLPTKWMKPGDEPAAVGGAPDSMAV